MAQDDQLEIFELGKVSFDGKEIYLEEITVNVTRELNEYYTTDSFEPKDIRPGRQKIDFTIRKAKDLSRTGSLLMCWFANTKKFNMTLYALNVNQEKCKPRKVAELYGCRLSRNQIGNFDASKPVQEDIEGKASRIVYFDKNGRKYETFRCGVGNKVITGTNC